MNGHNHPLEDETVSDIEADEDQDTRINENDNVDNKEFFYDPPKKPLGWLSHSSAPGKDMTSVRGLYIDAHPVRLADISLFDEETDKNDLTIATAVATVLWNWHPNALRALLDCDRFYTVAWARHVPCVGLRPMVIVERNDHALTVGFYSTRDEDWLKRCDIGIETSGKWTLLDAAISGSYITKPQVISDIAQSLAGGLFYDKVHEPWQGEKITIEVTDLNYKAVGGSPTNPHVLYERLDPSACVQCLRLPADLQRSGKFRHCGRCHEVRYCSQECQKEDWRVHKGLCQRMQPDEEEL